MDARIQAHWQRLIMSLVTAVAGTSLAAGSAIGAGDACDRWPRYSKVEPWASNIVLVRVTRVQNGAATFGRVADVLRGESPSRVRFDRLDPGSPKGRRCDSAPPVLAEVGDRLVVALDGRLPGRVGRVDTVAIVGDRNTPNPMQADRLTRVQVRQVDDRRPRNAVPLDAPPPRPRGRLAQQVRDVIREAIWQAVRAVDRDIRAPWPERPPTPLPPDADPLELAVVPPAPPRRPSDGWGCPEALWTGRLGIVDEALVAVKGSPIVWPRGFSARVVDDVAELVAPDGVVVARAGERTSAGGGYFDGVFVACSVGDTSYSPAS